MGRGRDGMLILSLMLGAPVAPLAQTTSSYPPVAPDSSACQATAGLIERMLSRRDVFTLALTAIDSGFPLPAPAADGLAKAIMAHFVAPDSVPQGVTPTVAFRIRPGGFIDSLRFERPSAREIEHRLLLAMYRADSSRTLASAGSAIDRATWIRARLDHAILTEPDPARWRSGVEIPIGRVAIAAPGNRPPRYPDVARNAGVGDTVIIRFVVDEHGRPMSKTVYLRKARYREFVKAVVDHLPSMRFLPAELDGCPVKSWVEMPFTFSLAR